MSLYIVDYSERAIALFGETSQYKDNISAIGGKFNASLKNNDQKLAGWIFPKSKKSEVEKLLNSIKEGTLTRTETKEPYIKKNITEEYVSKKDFMNLLSKVERLEQENDRILKLLNLKGQSINKQEKKNEEKKQEEEEEEEEQEEEEEKPKRLLRKK